VAEIACSYCMPLGQAADLICRVNGQRKEWDALEIKFWVPHYRMEQLFGSYRFAAMKEE
jgi:hypothetical protein